jgi:hypothetical protein
MKCATKADAKQAATTKVREHERTMHKKEYAKGGMVARGCGAATKGKKFTRAG